MKKFAAAGILALSLGGVALSAQDTLSAQVLRLLARVNVWTNTNVFTNGVGISSATPTDTTDTLYQVGSVLYWNGAIVTTATGVGTVTSVALAAPAIFAVSGSPVTSSGTLTLALADQAANVAWAGPASGAATSPTFRYLVDADIPDTITIAGTANVSWASVNKSGSSLADLATRSAADLTTGTLPDGRFPATLPAVSGANLTTLNATNLASGAVPAARMPALTGDVTTSAGSIVTSLAATGISAGAYGGAGNLLSLTVDAKGRITAIANVAAGTHTLLSATHTDTLAGTVARGDVIVGNSTPAWTRLPLSVTPGAVLRSDGTDALWSTDGSGLTALNASNLSTGTVPVTRGGTGLTSAAAAGQLPIGNGTGYTLATLTGTANQVVVTNGAGSITLATPQAIGTASTPQFGRLGIGVGADATALLYVSGGTVRYGVTDEGNSGAAKTINLSTNPVHKLTLTADTTLTLTNPQAGTTYILDLRQDGTGGWAVTWPTIRWAGGSSPTITTGAAKADRVTLFYDGTSFFGSIIQNF